MTKAFSKFDQLNGRCTEEEIGTAWENRWGIPELEGGACTVREVGTTRIDPVDLKKAMHTFNQDVDHMPGVYLDAARREFRRNPALFISENPSVANKLLDLDKIETAKAAEAKAPSIATITQDELSKTTTCDLKRMALFAACEHLPAETQEMFYIAFKRWMAEGKSA